MDILKTIITIVLAVISLFLTIIVLMQEGKSEGLGSLGGGTASSDTYWSKNKGRSVEGALAKITKVLAVLFFLLSFLLNLKVFN